MIWAQKQRMQTIETIKSTFVKANDIPIDEEKLISEIMLQFGTRKQKAKEYINDLLFSKFIKRVDTNLILVNQLTKEDKDILENA